VKVIEWLQIVLQISRSFGDLDYFNAMIFRAATGKDFAGILAIQKANLRASVSAADAAREGYLTAVHTEELLRLLNAPVPHTVVVSATEEVLGYALSMSPQHRASMALLKPMFAAFEASTWKGEPISGIPYTAMGQVALQPKLRGTGAFRIL